MDATPKRPWYRLHWGTVLVVFFVGMQWSEYAFYWTFDAILYREEINWSIDGWPFSVAPSGELNRALLALDLGILLAALSSVAVTIERLERADLRFTLATGALIFAVVCMLLAAWQAQYQYRWSDFGVPYQPLGLPGWPAIVTIVFAMGCTFYTGLWIGLRAAVWSLSFLRRPAPATVETDGSHP